MDLEANIPVGGVVVLIIWAGYLSRTGSLYRRERIMYIEKVLLTGLRPKGRPHGDP